MQIVYKYVDDMPSSRTKKNLNRDFSDGCYMAEIVKHYIPASHKGMIELHNYISSSQVKIKRSNWDLLNKKIFSKLGKAAFIVDEEHIEKII